MTTSGNTYLGRETFLYKLYRYIVPQRVCSYIHKRRKRRRVTKLNIPFNAIKRDFSRLIYLVNYHPLIVKEAMSKTSYKKLHTVLEKGAGLGALLLLH